MDATEITIYHAVVMAFFAIAAVLLFLFFSIIRVQRRNMAIRRMHTKAQIENLERDRSRIAIDLHDELGPMLSAVKFRIASLELAGEAERSEIRKINTMIDSVITRIRSISYNLMPNTLVRKGLTTAVREFIDFIDSRHEIAFSLRADASIRIDESRCINIYRILQEVIHNAVKHSRASEVDIDLEMKKQKLIIRVTDNGKGFDYKREIGKNSGVGLGSLNSRALTGEGKMFVKSNPGKGTSYLFEMPV